MDHFLSSVDFLEYERRLGQIWVGQKENTKRRKAKGGGYVI